MSSSKFTIEERLLVVHHKKIKHPFYLRHGTRDKDVFEQVFVHKEYAFTSQHTPDTIIDAGAHIGLASLCFANLFPEAQIISLEPDPANFEMLKMNTEAYTNITPLYAALWHKQIELNLMDSTTGNWAYMTHSQQTGDPQNVRNTVQAVDIPFLLKHYQLKEIDLLKIDIEGAEKEVFQDSSGWIDTVNSLIIELHERMKPGCNRSFYNGSNGFDLEWIRGENIYLSRRGYLSPAIS